MAARYQTPESPRAGYVPLAARRCKSRSTPTAAMPRGLAIFDFDCTLTKFHVWGQFRQSAFTEVLIDADTFVDLPAFKALYRKHGPRTWRSPSRRLDGETS